LDHWKSAKHFDHLAMCQHLLTQQTQLEQALSLWTKQQKLSYTFTLAQKPLHLLLSISGQNRATFEARRELISQFVLALATADNNLFIQEDVYSYQFGRLIFKIHINDTQIYLSNRPSK